MYQSTELSWLSRLPTYVSIYLSTYLSVHLAVYQSICLSIYLNHLSMCPSVYPPTADYFLRLVPLNASSAAGAGRLDLWVGGEWRPVCEGGWGREEATVACRQLGYEQLVQSSSELLCVN